MKSEDWQKIETVFHEALLLNGAAREKYLEEACRNDNALLNEIKTLLASFENEKEFLEKSLVDLGLSIIQEKNEKRLTETNLGFYQIGEKLGSGGMGEVYAAVDTRLNRKAALKFLPESLKNDNLAKRQLRKEAQAIALLNHPNICAVHGIEEIGGEDFIVMQFIEGETLEKRLKTMTTTIDSFKLIAKQIIDAVAFAHSHGIIHRDLKPGNIMISGEAQIKVLDFGLAKLIGEQKIIGSKSSANSSELSANGLVIGTVSYMSPEQLRGERLDYQTDIFSLGIILYELLANDNPFQRQTPVETIAAILSDNSVTAEKITPKLPINLCRLIDKCLTKDKKERFQSAAEILVEFDKIDTESSRSISSTRLSKFYFSAAAVAALLLTALLGYYFFLGKASSKTLAVMPIYFDNLPVEKEYLADGLTQSIIDKLSNLTNFKVKSELLISRYRGKVIDPQIAGRELNADAVLTGSIIKRENIFFLLTKLVRTSDGLLLDIDEEKIEDANLLELQEKISWRIINKLNSDLSADEKNKLARKETESEEAKRFYSLGRLYLKKRSGGDDLGKAIEYFTDAKDIDPNYAKAWAGLADAYLAQSAPGVKRPIPPQKAVELAKLASQKALELDRTLPESYNSLGLISARYEWNWNEAESFFRTASQLSPEFLPARSGLISILSFQGRFDEALDEALKAKEIDPLSLNSDIQIAQIFYRKYDFAQMDGILSDLLVRFPENTKVKYVRSYQFLKMKRYREAIDLLEPIYQSNNQQDQVYVAAPLGFAYAKSGQNNLALKIIGDLGQIKKTNYVPAQEEALIYVALGNYDKVFEFLNQSCKERFSALPGWITDPLVDEVWSDPRFAQIRKCANL